MVQSGFKFRNPQGVRAIKDGIKADPSARRASGRKPPWLRVRLPGGPRFDAVRRTVREHRLSTVCEESHCPNIGECWSHGTATLMLMGSVCTRACRFCAVDTGNPRGWLDPDEPRHAAESVRLMGLKYVVLTSVDRDDLRDGGAGHFRDCIRAVRRATPATRIEILTPDFRRRMDVALERLGEAPPDVFNHNLETTPALYRKARPGADYHWSLDLIRRFKAQHPHIPTKSGLMLGLGEEIDDVRQVLRDLRDHDCDMLTLGQYLQPSRYHLKVERFVEPSEFAELGDYARQLGFTSVASAPMVRSSYHADLQAAGV